MQPRKKKERTPLGGMRQKLSAPDRAGYVKRWFNDDGQRILDAQNAGYEFVTDQDAFDETESHDLSSKRVSQVVGTKEDGSPLTAYLMETRQEYYEEDQAAKQAKIDEGEEGMRRGELDGKTSPGTYGEVRIKSARTG